MKPWHAFGGSATVLAIALLALPPAAGARDADDVSETRPVAAFDAVRIEGAFTTEISAGANPARVVVSGRRDIVDAVTTSVEGRTLVVAMDHSSHEFEHTPRLSIAVPALHRFTNRGAGSATIRGLDGGDLEIENSGAANIVASGRVGRETVSLAGTGKIDLTDVAAHDVTVANDGVGSVYVKAAGQLTMSVNGVGEVRYTGNPTHVSSTINGIGRISRL